MSEEILEKGSLAGLVPPPPSYMHMDKANGWTDTQQWDGDDGDDEEEVKCKLQRRTRSRWRGVHARTHTRA